MARNDLGYIVVDCAEGAFVGSGVGVEGIKAAALVVP
jgi:hypothetical protein